MRMLSEALDEIEAPYRLFNQRLSSECDMELEVGDRGVDGSLRLQDETFRLEDISAVYFRLMDDRILPELEGAPSDSPARLHTRALHDALYRWIEITDALVVNRSDPQGSNSSKPYQAQLIAAHGLRVPETLITNDPEEVLAFRRAHGAVIYKSMSGVRSIVHKLSDEDIGRLDDITWCPVQFQALVPGHDVRVHVVDRDIHATQIVSDAVDYRYAKQAGGSAELRAFDLPPEVAERCVELTAALGLSFAGIDLRMGPSGGATCFEVNPSPAYSYYEGNTGQPISRSLARLLKAGAAMRP
jgi:glutathione synthase/RimK-type ligase-like ATP-grasp enzyme